jgi:hypothetical protein
MNVFEPLHTELIDAHRRITYPILIARDTNPLVAARPQNARHVSVSVHFCDRGVTRNLQGAGAHCTRNLHRFRQLIDWTRVGTRWKGDSGVAVAARGTFTRGGGLLEEGHRRSIEREPPDRVSPR